MTPDPNPKLAAEQLDLAGILQIFQQTRRGSSLDLRCREQLANSLAHAQPRATGVKAPRFLTIGMATANDFDGAYFTIQSIRLHHPEILDQVEFLVIDNAPTEAPGQTLREFANWVRNLRYIPAGSWQSTAVRDLVFREAAGEFVLCVDSHVLFAPGSLAKLIAYCKQNPDTGDLLQGPMLSDALEVCGSHFEPVWSSGMFGTWGVDERAKDPGAPPFEVGMQGLGVFGCRKLAWPGLNPRLNGFGGEEGYLHEKIRRAGGRTLCLPFLRWMHRFFRPYGTNYRVSWQDRIRNYLLIAGELGIDPAPVIGHFTELLGKEEADAGILAAENELRSAFHWVDAVYCIQHQSRPAQGDSMLACLRSLRIEAKIRRFRSVDTPINGHIGCMLAHRRIVAEARLQVLNTVVIFDDDVSPLRHEAVEIEAALSALQGIEWQIGYLGRTAIAYHRSFFDILLEAVPDDAFEVARAIPPMEEQPGTTMQQLFRIAGVEPCPSAA